MRVIKVRLATASGCACDRLEPAEDLILHGNIDYLVFECLSEKSMAESMLEKLQDETKGYNCMLEERMDRLLKIAKENNVKIISNMGATNVDGAISVIEKSAKRNGIKNLKIGALYGDDVLELLTEEDVGLKKEKLISANAYLGYEGLKKLIDLDCDVIVTGRIADVSLYVAPIAHEFKEKFDKNILANATLLGHLMECGGQLTGGYAMDPGYKDILNLDILGFPIATIFEDGKIEISKLENTGGEISERITKEQLSYEIFDLKKYITPDAIVDFTNVNIKEIEKDKVLIDGAKFLSVPDNYKVNVGYRYGFLGVGEVGYAGTTSYKKALVAKDILTKRIKLANYTYNDLSFDFIGLSSIVGDKIRIKEFLPKEVRLKMSVRTNTQKEALLVSREMSYMFTNGPSGGASILSYVKEQIGIKACFIKKDKVKIETKVISI